MRRTLTSLYTQRPTWLDLAYRTLDHALPDARGRPHTTADDGFWSHLLALHGVRSHQKNVNSDRLDEHPPPRLGQDPSGNAVAAARGMVRCARHRKLPTLLRR